MNTKNPRGFIPLVAMIVLGLLAIAGGTATVLALKGKNSPPQQIEATVVASTTPDAPQGTTEANKAAYDAAPDFISDSDMDEMVRTGQAKPVTMEVTSTAPASVSVEAPQVETPVTTQHTEEEIANFNSLMQKLYAASGSNGNGADAAKKKQVECLLEPTPTEWRTLSPQQQQYLREQKCDSNTSTSDLNYKLTQMQTYQTCVTEYTLKSAGLKPGDSSYPMYGGDPALHCDYLKPTF